MTSKILHHEWPEDSEYINPDNNAKRVANRVLNGGHDVPIPKIISRYDKSIANCIALTPYVDRLYVYDNSIENTEAHLLFPLSNGTLTKRYTDHLPAWATTISSPDNPPRRPANCTDAACRVANRPITPPPPQPRRGCIYSAPRESLGIAHLPKNQRRSRCIYPPAMTL